MRKECLNTVYSLAKKDKKLLFIGSDLGPGVLSNFKEKYSRRFFMEGVSEQAIIGIAAGLAMEGFRPYINTIATFLTRRCFEQICIDICLHNLNVKLLGNGGGLVYAPLGPTHIATDDLSILRTLPNMKIIAPCDSVEMRQLILQINKIKGPCYVRIAKGGDEVITKKNENIKFGQASVKIKPKDIVFLTTGVMAQVALKAIEKLKNKKIKAGLIHFSTVKPLDVLALKKWIPKVKKVITVEENTLIGGFGSSVLEFIADYSPKELKKISRIGLLDKFTDRYGSQDELFKHYNLSPEKLVKKALE